MAFTFQPDPTLANFNSYCDVTFAKDFQDSRLNTAFLALPDATIQRLLVWATRQLSQLEWQGSKTVIDQPQEWPRKYVFLKGGTSSSEIFDQYQFTWNSIPTFLKEATADLAGILAQDDVTEDSGVSDFSKLRVDVIEIETKTLESTSWLPSSTRSLCARYLLNTSSYSTKTVRVG